nr:hypothetical protein [Brucella abortus]
MRRVVVTGMGSYPQLVATLKRVTACRARSQSGISRAEEYAELSSQRLLTTDRSIHRHIRSPSHWRGTAESKHPPLDHFLNAATPRTTEEEVSNERTGYHQFRWPVHLHH